MTNNLKDVDAIILCGGLGKRLRPIISDKQKVLINIENKVFIDILIDNLLLYGFKNIILCVGYKKEQVIDHFKNNSNYQDQNYNIMFSEENKPLGTGGALKNAISLIKSNHFIVMNGDSISNINFREFFEYHKNKNALLSMALVKSKTVQDYGSVTLDNISRITSFNEKINLDQKILYKEILTKDKGLDKEFLINAGIYLMRKDIFSYMSEKDNFSLEYELFPNIVNKKCYGFVIDRFIDIGTPDRYEKASKGLGDILTIDIGTIKDLEKRAKQIRRHVISMIYNAGSGHPGGSMSCVDILTTLYFHFMRHDPLNPRWEDRDRFILSKGHAAPTLYAILAESGYIPVEELNTLRKFGSRLQGHPDINFNFPGIEVSTGSLGQGLSIGCGIALNARLEKKDFKTYVLLGDGELDEGQIWEAALFASHNKLNNLTAIIDRNKYQIDGKTEEILSLEPLEDKWITFGWNVLTIDGHNIRDLINIFERIKTNSNTKPTVVIANTIKGKGISFMEDDNNWHGKAPGKEEYELAIKKLE